MKTTLTLGVSLLLIYSCVDTSETQIVENLPDDEAKSLVEVEEISYNKDSLEPATISNNQPRFSREIDPAIGGCVIPRGELVNDSLIAPPEPIGCPKYPDSDIEVFDIPEIDAQFPGGVLELKKFIYSHLEPPVYDGGFEYQGTVYVSFEIGKDGSISNAQVVRGIIDELDKEALRVVNSMPNWIPAQINGKIVAARVRLPIHFKLY